MRPTFVLPAVDLFISSTRLGRQHDRFPSVSAAGSGRSQILSTTCIVACGASSTAGDQCGWPPYLSLGHCRTETNRRTQFFLPLPTITGCVILIRQWLLAFVRPICDTATFRILRHRECVNRSCGKPARQKTRRNVNKRVGLAKGREQAPELFIIEVQLSR